MNQWLEWKDKPPIKMRKDRKREVWHKRGHPMTWTQTELKKILREVRLQMKGTDASDVYVRGWRHAIREVEWAIARQVEADEVWRQKVLERETF